MSFFLFLLRDAFGVSEMLSPLFLFPLFFFSCCRHRAAPATALRGGVCARALGCAPERLVARLGCIFLFFFSFFFPFSFFFFFFFFFFFSVSCLLLTALFSAQDERAVSWLAAAFLPVFCVRPVPCRGGRFMRFCCDLVPCPAGHCQQHSGPCCLLQALWPTASESHEEKLKVLRLPLFGRVR